MRGRGVGDGASAAVVALSLWVLRGALDVVLLVFAGVLLANLLRGLADWLTEHTPLPEKWAVGAVMLAIVGLLGVGLWLLAPSIAEQTD